MNINDLYSPQAEAGVIASLIYNPEFFFHSDALKPQYFYNQDNGYIYYAIGELAKKGTTSIDSYNIMMILNSHKATEKLSKTITTESLNELITVGKLIYRDNTSEYLILAEKVMDMAFRRAIYKELESCKSLCFTETEENIKDIVYSRVDKTISEFAGTDKIAGALDKVNITPKKEQPVMQSEYMENKTDEDNEIQKLIKELNIPISDLKEYLAKYAINNSHQNLANKQK